MRLLAGQTGNFHPITTDTFSESFSESIRWCACSPSSAATTLAGRAVCRVARVVAGSGVSCCMAPLDRRLAISPLQLDVRVRVLRRCMVRFFCPIEINDIYIIQCLFCMRDTVMHYIS
jgi:hypothetical protein